MRTLVIALALLIPVACQSGTPGERASVEIDGSWSREFTADRDAVYHAAIAAFDAGGYTFHSTNPLAGEFTAKSPVGSGLATVTYTIAHVVVETTPAQKSKVRLSLVRTREPIGGGRRPTNDLPVRDRGEHEAWLQKIAEELP